MNTTNPYKSPVEKKGETSAWRLFDCVAAAIWLAMPIGVFVGRRALMPVFEEYGLAVPIATQYLLNTYAPVVFALAAASLLLPMALYPSGVARRRFICASFVAGSFIALACLLSFLLPLLALWRDLA